MAIAGLVGMFADKATQKLSEVFDTLFKTEKNDQRKDKLAKLSITALEPCTVLTGATPPPSVIIRGSDLAKVTAVNVDGEKRSAASVTNDSVTVELTAKDVAKTADLSITVEDPDGSSGVLTLHVSDLKIATNSLPAGVVGQAYQQELTAKGGTQPFTWGAAGLSQGLKVEGSQVTGTPEQAFDGTIRITVTDSVNATAGAAIPLKITLPAQPGAH
jgi:hypothetical protein